MIEKNCLLTGTKVQVEPGNETDFYELKILDKLVEVFICNSCKKVFNPLPHHIIKGLILNEIWPKRSYLIAAAHAEKMPPENCETIILNEYLQKISYPKTPTEKLNSLFLYLFSLQQSDGQTIEINFNEPKVWMKNYFADADECFFYVQGLTENNLIQYQSEGIGEYVGLMRITHKGLNYAIEISKEGNNSKNCFIAMAFDETTQPYREAIRNAIAKTGFQLIIIDEEHIDSNKTIPDAIFLGIQRSKFCIADFSLHKNGVYFESGYALGLGKPVIYTCQEDEFAKAHFDIKQLQQIIYKTPQDLEEKLIDKIEAWIK